MIIILAIFSLDCLTEDIASSLFRLLGKENLGLLHRFLFQN